MAVTQEAAIIKAMAATAIPVITVVMAMDMSIMEWVPTNKLLQVMALKVDMAGVPVDRASATGHTRT